MNSTTQTDKDAQLIPFPTAPPAEADTAAVKSQPEVLDGEIVTPDENKTRRIGLRDKIKVVATRTDRDQTAQFTAALPAPVRVTIRTLYTTGQGVGSWWCRAFDALTHGHAREQVRLARMTGNSEALAEWSQRLVDLKNHRHKRLRDLPATILSALHAAGIGACVLAAILIIGGVWSATRGGMASWDGWWTGLGTVTNDTFTGIGIVFWIALFAAPLVFLVSAWREGQRVATAPSWLVSPQERAEQMSEITPDLITDALRHMKITTLTKFLNNGGALEYVVHPREQGGGTYTQIRLPLGVTAAEFLPSHKVELLAGNLGRHRHETWPQREKDSDARVLDLWVADKGTMDKAAPPWPLLNEGSFDVFRDRLPWGVTMRSEQIAVGMLQKHWLVGATSNQGKTTVVRLLALGLALDVTVELHIADLKGDGDWSMFAPRAATLIEGSSDEKAEATCDMLEAGVREVARRYERKQKQGIVGPIPREVSRRKGSGFHPIYLIVDECQVLYAAPHPIGGTKDDARAWRAAKKLHDQARAVNVHLIQATQRPDDRTLPARVREGAHVRCALNVPNYEAAKMILADAADRGARPHDLRPGADAGTVVATGAVENIPKGQAFAIVRSHYVATKQAYGVIARAMDLLHRAGRTVGDVEEELAEPPDHLANIAKVLDGVKRARTHVVLKRLSELDPREYETWTFGELKKVLDEAKVPVRKSDGLMTVFADDVAEALAKRDRQEDGVDEEYPGA